MANLAALRAAVCSLSAKNLRGGGADNQGSKKYRTYDRAVVAKQGCFEDAHVSELIIPHN